MNERYYAYENWRAKGHGARVHNAGCSFCNDGKGVAGGTRPDNGKWHSLGIFETPEDALAKARAQITGASVRFCQTCCKSLAER